jgi:outer membrane lipoprotein-sorting protein
MLRRQLLAQFLLVLVTPLAWGAAPNTHAGLSAAQIVDKNVQARGGLPAWRAVQTLSFAGKLDAGGKQDTQLPFRLELKRPHKTRVEIDFQNDKAVQVFDGSKGWKLRPFLNRRDVEPFTDAEMQAASMESELDGPLVDYASKGTKVALDAVEQVEGRDAYKLRLTMKDGRVQHVWIDAQTFLETKVEGNPRRMDGRMRPVEVYYRDYKNVNGLMIPYVLETTVQGVKRSHKMSIESVVVNPKLDDSRFVAPKST